ncbi:MAG TPA: hypothetical protein PK718_04625 [Candidatus Methanofastidiosa archaeon]|nr:hypothetical protein [Candidatus Methanofastidiosa archaeon]HPR41815.1 hypothetical protein [Candidatus Methanofastidiosa archaeon]
MKKISIIVMIIVLTVSICGCAGSYDKLDATVEYGQEEIRITNENDYVWDDVTLELNDTYECWFKSLSPGKTRIVQLFDFSDETGMNFLPNFQDVESLVIKAYRPDGEESVYSSKPDME